MQGNNHAIGLHAFPESITQHTNCRVDVSISRNADPLLFLPQTTLTLFKSFSTIYLDILIQPHLNHLI